MDYRELKAKVLEIIEGCMDTCPDWFDPDHKESSIAITYRPVKDKITISWCTDPWIGCVIEGEDEPIEHEKSRKKPRDKSGYVYVLRADNGRCKIGRAKRIDDRIYQLGMILPYDPDLICAVWVDDYVTTEKQLHRLFTLEDKHVKGEWFELTESDIEYIKGLGAQHG
jgi:hypothetical protein